MAVRKACWERWWLCAAQDVGRGVTWLSLSLLGLLVSGCFGDLIDGPAGPASGLSGDAGSSDSAPEPAAQSLCERPAPAAVTKLLRLSNAEYRNLAEDVLGEAVDAALFEHWPPVAEVYGFDTMTETRIDARALEEQLRTSEQLAERVVRSKTLTADCVEASALRNWDNCAESVVTRLAERAFRRPLRAGEIAPWRQLYEKVYASAAAASIPKPFDEGLRAAAQAVLLSPQATFKPELLPGAFTPDESAYALASRLALFFRASVPDERLLSLAKSGELLDPKVLRAEAERLVEQYAERIVRDFAGQWLGFRSNDTANEEGLDAAMRREAEAVFAEVLAQDLPPSSLLLPGFTFVDADLAAHYGLPFDPAGTSMQQVETDERGGLLSQGRFLTSTAKGSDFRRAIHRGLWTLTRLLCREMPRLDAATAEQIASSLETIDRTAPLAEQMAIHRMSGPQCISCHGEMDPVGLALEKYDASGRWREVDANGHAIESSLELFGEHVPGPRELAEAIADAPEFSACVAEKALTYAMHRGVRPNEACVPVTLAKRADGADASMREILVDAVVESFSLAVEAAPKAPADRCPMDSTKTEPGSCGCGISEVDRDDDGTPDCFDSCPDDPHKVGSGACGCGNSERDADGDGTADCSDGCPSDPGKTTRGICGCGTSDADSDGDGAADCVDACEGPAIGCRAGGLPSCPSGYLDVLDPDYYRMRYSDLQAAFGNDRQALQNHYLQHGINEGRDASAHFSPRAYLARYADLSAAFGSTGYRAALDHWINNGLAECRNVAP